LSIGPLIAGAVHVFRVPSVSYLATRGHVLLSFFVACYPRPLPETGLELLSRIRVTASSGLADTRAGAQADKTSCSVGEAPAAPHCSRDSISTGIAGLAGESLKLSRLAEGDIASARRFFELRYWGALTAAKCGHSRIRPGGSIVFTSGVAGARPGPGWSVAASICSAMEGLTRALAAELAPVRVNIVSPGVVKTPLWREMTDDARAVPHPALREKLDGSMDDYRTLDVRRWAREGVLRPGYSGGWQWTRDGETVASIQMRAEQDRVILSYRHRSGDGEWKDEQYGVRIVRTPCRLGSSRAWFICPAVGCGQRVAILYGGGIFACRHCYQIAYASSREDAGGRATRRTRASLLCVTWILVSLRSGTGSLRRNEQARSGPAILAALR
jgi:NAD(P)-dependent dehydrogenase (short-subunit alcohol dehydrogenase family)